MIKSISKRNIALGIGLLTFSAVYAISDEMNRFREGCEAMREAVEKNDFSSLTDARLTLGKLHLVAWDKGDLESVDEESENAIGLPLIYFTPEYADELAKSGRIILDPVDKGHLMRDVDYDLQLWHASLLPGKSCSFRTLAVDECELLLFSLSDSNLSLSVGLPDGSAIKGEKIGNGESYCEWEMPSDPSEFVFTITNHGDQLSTFVLAIN